VICEHAKLPSCRSVEIQTTLKASCGLARDKIHMLAWGTRQNFPSSSQVAIHIYNLRSSSLKTFYNVWRFFRFYLVWPAWRVSLSTMFDHGLARVSGKLRRYASWPHGNIQGHTELIVDFCRLWVCLQCEWGQNFTFHPKNIHIFF
jgi:hypothetical protein